ncbi:MAG: glycosyltransferase family 2 protein [Lachnospiraceae bacterium]|nr:glycosyltransferase family 2 protein [Lachnospiraceae bacterium]
MNELISVLIPAYNVANYLARCIESVLAQTHKNLEIIIVNDGSTDGTAEICDKYAEQYENIRVLHQENLGLAETRNILLREASGKYICFVDSDDCIHPLYCEKLYRMIKDDGADLSKIATLKFQKEIPQIDIDNYGKPIVCNKYYPLEQMLTDYSWLTSWGKMYKKDLFQDITYPIGASHEDEFITYKLFYKCSKIVHSKIPLYFYYTNKNSIMNRKFNPSRLSVLLALAERKVFFEKHNEEKLAQLTTLKLLSMCRRNYFLVKQELGNESVCRKIKEGYIKLFRENKKRCGIKFITYPELYIIPYPALKYVCMFIYHIKLKLGLKCW